MDCPTKSTHVSRTFVGLIKSGVRDMAQPALSALAQPAMRGTSLQALLHTTTAPVHPQCTASTYLSHLG